MGLAGDDLLRGGSGNDVLQAGSDDDKVYGNAGDDNLQGGPGLDQACTAIQGTIFYSEVSMTTLYQLGMEMMNSMPATVMTYYKVGLELITLIVVVDSI